MKCNYLITHEALANVHELLLSLDDCFEVHIFLKYMNVSNTIQRTRNIRWLMAPNKKGQSQRYELESI